MEPKKPLSQKFKNLKRKRFFIAFLTCLIIGLIISVAVLASVKNEKIIYKDKPVSVSQTSAREIKSLTQVIAKAQEDKALLEAQQKPENNAKIKALTTLITQLQTTKKTIEDNAQDIERFRLKIKRLEQEKNALNTQLEAAKQDKSNSAKIRELEAQISQKDRQIKDKNTQIKSKNAEISSSVKRVNALVEEKNALEQEKNALEEEKANVPAIAQELKEIKELRKQRNTALNKYNAAIQKAASKIPGGHKPGETIDDNPEIEATLKVFTKAQDELTLLKNEIIKALIKIQKDIRDNQY